MAHVICSRKILSIVDEWSVLRTYDDIIEDWYLNQDGTFKHLIISGVEYSHWKLFLVPQDILYSPMHWKPAAVYKKESLLQESTAACLATKTSLQRKWLA